MTTTPAARSVFPNVVFPEPGGPTRDTPATLVWGEGLPASFITPRRKSITGAQQLGETFVSAMVGAVEPHTVLAEAHLKSFWAKTGGDTKKKSIWPEEGSFGFFFRKKNATQL